VVRAASALGWLVTLLDHRPAYAAAEHFPEAEQVLQSSPAELARRVPLGDFQAAVVMSHHLPSDLEYLRQLATHPVPYIGLLGPAARRQRLLAELGASAASLEGRLYGPVGLDIGARTPDAIALAIVAEIHAVLAGRSGRPFSVVTRTASPR
jgi:xanthine/CO dehydrogenase XdhC/CoxF family maturation factor